MDTTEALRLADSILTIEPENSMVIEYRMALEQIDDEEVAEAKEAGEEKAESSDEESFGGGEEISDSESKDDDSAESKEDAEGGSEDDSTEAPRDVINGEAKLSSALSVEDHLARFTHM